MSLTLVRNILDFYFCSALTSCHSKSKTRGALIFLIWQRTALQEGKLLFQVFFCLCSKFQNNRHLREIDVFWYFVDNLILCGLIGIASVRRFQCVLKNLLLCKPTKLVEEMKILSGSMLMQPNTPSVAYLGLS